MSEFIHRNLLERRAGVHKPAYRQPPLWAYPVKNSPIMVTVAWIAMTAAL
jgi:hypothetical protein